MHWGTFSWVAVVTWSTFLMGSHALDAKDTVAAAADGFPVHEVQNIILLAPEQLSILKVLGDKFKLDHMTTDQLLNGVTAVEQGTLEQIQDGGDLSNLRKDKRFVKSILSPDDASEAGPGQYSPWDRVFPAMLKRRAGGKLCYINPIACFGRRQREASK